MIKKFTVSRIIISTCVILAISLLLWLYLHGYFNPERTFLEACKTGNVELVRKMLKSGKIDANGKGDYEGCYLMIAAGTGNVEIVNILIENGADVNNNKSLFTALHMAVSRNHPEIVELLLEHGAEVDYKKGINRFALGLAAVNGNDKIVKILLNHKADVNLSDSYGTALDYAYLGHSDKIAQLLKSYGAKTNAVLEAEKSGTLPNSNETKKDPTAVQSNQNNKLIFWGTVKKIEIAAEERSLVNWIVTFRVDKVISGDFSGEEFSFRIHSPSKSGLERGKLYNVEAEKTENGYKIDQYQWIGK
ncbi:MAG TPA: hypothetical protein DCZ94_10405 [Lentisphaeria bacterium]|nr:MAG: hypothetical protein A2X48_06280 [Lentisphaerae bacterium GWF2_49_21]HBC87355.1 hypothetical protein [Lentisphaeria bacterium]